jgi:hypothetical protein
MGGIWLNATRQKKKANGAMITVIMLKLNKMGRKFLNKMQRSKPKEQYFQIV